MIGHRTGILLLFLLSLLLHWHFRDYGFDDAYIHFSIARNWVEHGVPYFNLGERANGSSSALWSIALGVLFSFVGAAPHAVAIANGIFSAMAAALWGAVTARQNPSLGAGARVWLQFAFLGALLLSGIGQMESSLALTLAGSALYAAPRRAALGSFLLGLAVSTRPELIVLAAPFLSIADIQPRARLRCAILLLLGVLPFVVFNVYYFGTLIPQSIAAKRIVYSVEFNHFVQLMLSLWIGEEVTRQLRPVVGIFICLLCAGAIGVILQRGESLAPVRGARLLILAGILILAVYGASGGLPFPWYLPLITIPILSGITALGSTPAHRRLVALMALPPLGVLVQLLLAAVVSPGWYPGYTGAARVARYTELGADLRRVMPDATIVAPEIGALKFSFHGEVIDALGIVTSAALKHHPLKVPEQRPNGMAGAVPPDFIEETLPDAIVSPERFLPYFERSSSAQRYRRFTVPLISVAARREAEQVRGADFSSRDFWAAQKLLILVREERVGQLELLQASPE